MHCIKQPYSSEFLDYESKGIRKITKRSINLRVYLVTHLLKSYLIGLKAWKCVLCWLIGTVKAM